MSERKKHTRHSVWQGKPAMRAERMKRSTMTMTVQQQANTEGAAVTRTDLMHLLQEAGRPEQLDVSGQDLRGIDLMNCNLEGADLRGALQLHFLGDRWL